MRNDGVVVAMTSGIWEVNPHGTFTLRLASAPFACGEEPGGVGLTPPWTRVSCPAEGGIASINHAEHEGWTVTDAYNLATCTVEQVTADGRVTGRLVSVGKDDGSDRGVVEFDVPACE